MGSYTYKCQKCGNDFQSSIGGGLFDVPPELCPSCDKKMKKEAMEFWKNNPHADNDLRLGGGPSIHNISKEDFRALSKGEITSLPDPKTQIVFSSSSEFKKLTIEDVKKISDFASGVDLVRQYLINHSGEARAATSKFITTLEKAESPLAVAGAAFAATEVTNLAIKDGYSKTAAIGLGATIGSIGLIPHIKVVASAYDMTSYGANKLLAIPVWAYNTIMSHTMELAYGEKYGAIAAQQYKVEQYELPSLANTMYQVVKIADWSVTGGR